jgi:hypothetical protein
VRVCFDVHGANEHELFEQAKAVLEAFSEGRRWNIDMEAHEEGPRFTGSPPEPVHRGALRTWRGEVTASHEDLET